MAAEGVRWTAGIAAAGIMGFQYYAMIFGLGFAMGVVRALLIAPRLGELLAVVLEVPVLVAMSWVAARWLLTHRSFSLVECAVMGATAFSLIMVSEIVLAGFLRGQGMADWAADVATPIGLIGLAGQVAFGLMPVLVTKSPPSEA